MSQNLAQPKNLDVELFGDIGSPKLQAQLPLESVAPRDR